MRATAKPKAIAKPRAKPAPVDRAGRSREAIDAREDLFIEAYIANNGKGKEAAIKAGYAAHSAARQAVKLLERASVRTKLSTRRQALQQEFQLDTQTVISKLAKLIHADLRDLFDDDGRIKDPRDWPPQVAAAVTGYEVTEEYEGQGANRRFVGTRRKVKFIEPTAALALAMRNLGLFEKDNGQKGAAEAQALREFFQAIYGDSNKLPIALIEP